MANTITASASSGRIVKLDDLVINRIAAGEIIQRPANALKELLENAIDAKATSIEVLVKEGGLKLLQITDNGTGVLREDMPILCERFTTSKLRQYNDLNSIATYGFRGEALASITHIAHVTITTKTEMSQCAYRASYSDGELISSKPGVSKEPKPVAGKQGTQITVEDMFYNVPSRRRAFSKPNEEYARIIDVVNRYAVHTEGVAFACKKHGENTISVSTTSKNSTTDNIRLIYGTSIANELLAFDMKDEKYDAHCRGLITNANYHVKKFTFILFINNRLVESSSLRKAIENMYSVFLPRGTHPFVYISLDLDPAKIDVNVHPTKKEVNILHEDEIVARVISSMQKRLSENDHSRVFQTQTLLPGAPLDAAISSDKIRRSINMNGPQNPATFVRTDSKQQKIVSLLDPSFKGQKKLDLDNSEVETLSGKERVSIRLASIKELREEVKHSIHEDLTTIFTEHVFVGIVDLDARLCVIQHLTKLFLVDYGAVSAELFYQVGLSEFGNFGTIALSPHLGLRELLTIAATAHQKKQDPKDQLSANEKENHIGQTYQRLFDRRDMLKEYFAISISDDGKVTTLPLLMRDYIPPISKLPNFLFRLGPNVNWNTEKECFRTFLNELALFYVPEVYKSIHGLNGGLKFQKPIASRIKDTSIVKAQNDQSPADPKAAKICAQLEEVLFPAFKRRLIASKQLALGKRVNQIAELSQLYKTFERC